MKYLLHTPLCAVLACASLASAQDYENDTRQDSSSTTVSAPSRAAGVDYLVVYSNVPGLASALVPGMGGLEFNVGTSSSSAFDRLYNSPNGNWILTALMETTTTDDEVILLNNAVVVQEGAPAPYEAGQNHGTIDTRVDVNDAGQFVFATNVGPSTVNDDYIVRGDGAGAFTVIAREGDPIPTLPGNTYDDILESSIIAGDGSVGFSADGVDGTVTTTTDDLLILGATLLAQEGVTIPPGQVGAEFWENFDLSDYYVTEDGLHWLCQGDLTGATTDDNVLVLDGTVVLQENVVLPGTDANPIDGSGIVGCFLDEGGNWYARGNNDTSELDWVVRNGAVIAKGGDPITPSATELWDDTTFSDLYFLHVGNGAGDYVVGGVTDADAASNAVLVLNGAQVIARENDPVDLDGNGLFDDDAFIAVFGNDDAILLDDGTLRFVCSLQDSLGTDFCNVLLELSTGEVGTAYCPGDGIYAPCPLGNSNDGSMSGCDWMGTAGAGGALTATGSNVIANNDTFLVASNINADFGIFFASGTALQGPTLGDGLRCTGAGGGVPLIRLIVPTNPGSSTATHATPLQTLDTGIPVLGGTRYYQYWFRSGSGIPGGTANNTTNGYQIDWM